MHILRLCCSSLLRSLLASIVCLVHLLRLLCLLYLLSLLSLLHGEQLLLLEILRLPMGHLLLKMHLHTDGPHVGIRLHCS